MGDEKKPFNAGFAALASLRASMPAGPSLEEIKKDLAPPRAVVRIERKGRAGKEVTVIEHLELPIDKREVWLKELKAALGCGGSIEGVALVLQGDLRERAEKWLKKRGVKKVTVS
jgi:translation initiation factor 1